MLFLSSFLCQDLIFAAVLLGASIVLYSFFFGGVWSCNFDVSLVCFPSLGMFRVVTTVCLMKDVHLCSNQFCEL